MLRPRPNPYDEEQARALGLGQPQAMPGPSFRPPGSPVLPPAMAPQALARPPVTAPTGYVPKPIDPMVAEYVMRPRPERAPTSRSVQPSSPAEPAAPPAAAEPTSSDPDRGARVVSTLLGGLARLGPQGSKRPAYDEAYWDKRKKGREDTAARGKAERLADPASEESKKAQQQLAPYLQAAGYTPEDIARLSAQQLQGVDVTRLVGEREKLKRESAQQEAERARAQAEREAQRALELGDRDEERTYNAGRSDIEHERALELARVKRGARGGAAGGGGAPGVDPLERAREALDQHYGGELPAHVQGRLEVAASLPPKERAREAARILSDAGAVQLRDEMREERAAAAADARRDTNTQKYAAALDKSGIPAGLTTLQRARKAIAEAKRANGGEIFVGTDEAVRRGPAWASGMASDGAQAVMSAVQELQNLQIKDQSGSAVTDSEMARVNKALGTGAMSNEAALERYLAAVEEALATDQANWDRGFGPDVVEAYRGRGSSSTPSTSQAPEKVSATLDGKAVMLPADKVDAARAKYGDRLVLQ